VDSKCGNPEVRKMARAFSFLAASSASDVWIRFIGGKSTCPALCKRGDVLVSPSRKANDNDVFR